MDQLRCKERDWTVYSSMMRMRALVQDREQSYLESLWQEMVNKGEEKGLNWVAQNVMLREEQKLRNGTADKLVEMLRHEMMDSD